MSGLDQARQETPFCALCGAEMDGLGLQLGETICLECLECPECDGNGKIWNNADPTSGQFVECVCDRGSKPVRAATPESDAVHESPGAASAAIAQKDAQCQ